MSKTAMRITESDEAGNVLATYVQSPGGQDGLSRVDVVYPAVTKSPWQRTLDVFLPAGYPHSVTDDYLEYQIYDSLQAFSSSIAGMLSSRAVLSSVGVGDSTASPTAALLLSVLQESAGRVATIFFAHRFGTALEPECKMYRLLADVLNDIAFILDVLSPAFPKPVRVVILSFSSVLRALCGVAAGSAKASLSAHFARWGNLGELNAKDSSQETVISLLGMLAGSVVVSWVTTPIATWTVLILLLSIHLETNRRAVRAVSMRTLNRQRATLMYRHIKAYRTPCAPQAIAQQEQIFERDGVLRGTNGRALGYCRVGVSMSDLMSSMATQQNRRTRSAHLASDTLSTLLDLYKDEKYILWSNGSSSPLQVSIVVKDGAVTKDILVAWWQACLVGEHVADQAANGSSSAEMEKRVDERITILRQTKEEAVRMLRDYQDGLAELGWNLDVNALQTTSSVRISIA